MEEKTLGIAIPDGKTPEMTETENGCTIRWVDSKEKTFEYYARSYQSWCSYFQRYNPLTWSFAHKMGLLKHIADDLNECDVQTPACGIDRYRLYVNASGIFTYCGEGGGKEPATYFTQSAAERAIKIIPAEFILSF
jgi:hypothetical protein